MDAERRDRTTECDLGKVGERQSDDDGRNRALAGTDDVAHVDRNLADRGSGRDEGAVGEGAVGATAAARGKRVPEVES